MSAEDERPADAPADGVPMPAAALVDGDGVWEEGGMVLLDRVETVDGRVVGRGIDGEVRDWDPEETVYVEVDTDDDEGSDDDDD